MQIFVTKISGTYISFRINPAGTLFADVFMNRQGDRQYNDNKY